MVSNHGSLYNGRYELFEEIGRGAHGVVRRAFDTTLECEVAIKSSHPIPNDASDEGILLRRSLREGRVLAKIDHPNVVRVRDCFPELNQVHLVMDLMKGSSIQSRLKTQGKLSEADCWALGFSLYAGLAAIHEKNITHRDVKPANIMLNNRGVAQLVDFGLALHPDITRITKEGLVSGTVAYMSPEIVRGSEPEPPSDIWSAAVTLATCFTGTNPFVRSTQGATLWAIIGGSSPNVGRGPFAQLLARAFVPAGERPTAYELRDEIRRIRPDSTERLLGGSPSAERPVPLQPERPSRQSASRPVADARKKPKPAVSQPPRNEQGAPDKADQNIKPKEGPLDSVERGGDGPAGVQELSPTAVLPSGELPKEGVTLRAMLLAAATITTFMALVAAGLVFSFANLFNARADASLIWLFVFILSIACFFYAVTRDVLELSFKGSLYIAVVVAVSTTMINILSFANLDLLPFFGRFLAIILSMSLLIEALRAKGVSRLLAPTLGCALMITLYITM